MENRSKYRYIHTAGRVLLVVALAAFMVFSIGFDCSRAQSQIGRRSSVQSTSQARVRAPEFPQNAEWLNTDTALSIEGLRGKIVLLDFWTYCCINCMHVLPDLKRLEEKYSDELVVIGVHSAKFEGEKATENIRQAILRYEIEHPVVNDSDMRIWDAYAVRAWPTLVLIDPRRRVVGRVSGEGNYDRLDRVISQLIAVYEGQGLERSRMDFALEREQTPPAPLSFPGKIVADVNSERLFISDSNHNRILVTELNGAVRHVIGSGETGRRDGSFDVATFNHPQGMTLVGDSLYIADTENHLIRRANLLDRTVSTVAGTGEQSYNRDRSGDALRVGLNSPWDLVEHGGILYIAMAGSHQLWSLRLEDARLSPYAGSGAETLRDGALNAAALAQPSGITTDGRVLYFADSETSSIRTADLSGAAGVDTLVGRGLFVFGDRDGIGEDVRLQHPLGVDYHHGKVFIADTYNNRIKLLLPQRRQVITMLGSGEGGRADGTGTDATFDEPADIAAAGNKLYIADTNNHSIRVADLGTMKVSTLEISGLSGQEPSCPVVSTTSATLAPGDGEITVTVDLPEGLKLNPDGPSKVVVEATGVASFDGRPSTTVDLTRPSAHIPVDFQNPGRITAEVHLYYCSAEGICYFEQARMSADISISPAATGRTVKLRWRVADPT